MRASLSLDGVWQARLDGEPDFGRELRVPLPWQAADPALREHTGVVWYRRAIDVPADWHVHDVFVRFGAVDHRAAVYADGVEVGGHEGGYTPFEVPIPPTTRELTLRVEDPADLADVPHGKQGGRWYTRVSGPWQSVELLVRPKERIERVKVYPDVRTSTVRARIRCQGLARTDAGGRVGVSQARLVVEVLDAPGGSPIRGAQAEAIAAADIGPLVEIPIPSPHLWSPDDPHLYTLRVTMLGADTLDVFEQPFGLRSFESRDGQLLLNGQPFYMRGALDQAYWPDTLYTLPSDEEIEREIRLAKEMGLNLLRKHIKPEDPRYLDACDRLGMLVWAEPANPDRFTDTAKAALRRDLFEMVERDFNHPCVVVWSLYNEDWGVPGLFHDADQQAWVADLYRELKALDPTRLVCDNSGWAHVRTDLNDYHEYYAAPERLARFADRLDYLVAHPEENYALGHQPDGHEAILVSEWGNWGLADPAMMRERMGGEPHWLSRNGDFEADGMKRPAGFEARFEQLSLAKRFGSPAGLCAFLQRRAFRALAAQLGEMRRRPAIQGHVVTELTDIEWEGNGWLDYWRQPKAFTGELSQINGPIALIVTPARHVYWCDDEVVADVLVHNTTSEPVDATLMGLLEPGGMAHDPHEIRVAPFSRLELPGAIRFFAPTVSKPQIVDLRVDLSRLVTADSPTMESFVVGGVDLAFVPLESARVQGGQVGVVGLDRLFRQRLERFGHRARGPWRDAPVVLTNTLDDAVLAHLRAGGRVLYLAGAPPESSGLRTFPLPPGESWRMAAGAAWADAERLRPAPIDPAVGPECAAFFPHQVIDAACFRPDDEVLVGWLEGWLANAGALALLRTEGQGRLLATTFRFDDHYGVDPVATLLLNRFVAILAE